MTAQNTNNDAARDAGQKVIRHHFKPQNARFWVFVNMGWVKITLRPEDSLRWSKSYDNGEGWSWESATYTYDGETVYQAWGHGGNDCDGVTRTSGVDECPLLDLAAVASYRPHLDSVGVRRPAWVESEPVKCYDQYAQMANY